MILRQIPVMIIILWILMCISGFLPLFSPHQVSLENILETPGWHAWMGYDDLGRPVLDRLVMGARTSLLVAISVIALSSVLGTWIGMSAAWYGGWCDKICVLVIDIFMAFPGLLLAIALAGLLGPGLFNAVIALSVMGWVGFARLARAQTMAVKQREHVMAARALGSRNLTIMYRHLLPLILAPLIVESTFAIASVVIAEASLSFLGLGVQPPQASWGSMIREGTQYMLVAPHLVIVPGMTIFIVVLSVNLLGDRLRDRLDIKLKTNQKER